jgi:transcriptional regulator with XRE-family HTH domain
LSGKNRIKIIREARGWSLETLAERAGTINQQISLLEAGKRRLTVDWLLRLGKALDCHPWELVTHSLPEPPDTHEIILLEGFRGLPNDQQQALLALIGTMSKPLKRRSVRRKRLTRT